MSAYAENYKSIVWGDMPPDDRPRSEVRQGSLHVLRDVPEFRTQDGVVISSRSQLREYEQRNGVKQLGNDWPGREKPAFWDAHQEKKKAHGRRP